MKWRWLDDNGPSHGHNLIKINYTFFSLAKSICDSNYANGWVISENPGVSKSKWILRKKCASPFFLYFLNLDSIMQTAVVDDNNNNNDKSGEFLI